MVAAFNPPLIQTDLPWVAARFGKSDAHLLILCTGVWPDPFVAVVIRVVNQYHARNTAHGGGDFLVIYGDWIIYYAGISGRSPSTDLGFAAIAG